MFLCTETAKHDGIKLFCLSNFQNFTNFLFILFSDRQMKSTNSDDCALVKNNLWQHSVATPYFTLLSNLISLKTSTFQEEFYFWDLGPAEFFFPYEHGLCSICFDILSQLFLKLREIKLKSFNNTNYWSRYILCIYLHHLKWRRLLSPVDFFLLLFVIHFITWR